MAFTKKNKTTQILLKVYIVLSALFILITVFDYFKFNVYMLGYEKGKQEASNDIFTGLIQIALNKECKSFSVDYGNKAVKLINVDCVGNISDDKKQENKN